MPEVAAPDDLLDERSLSKLKWRCRRGLLENDLFIERFFQGYEARLTVRQAQGLNPTKAIGKIKELMVKRAV